MLALASRLFVGRCCQPLARNARALVALISLSQTPDFIDRALS